MADQQGPLTPQHLEDIKQQLADLAFAEREMDKAARAGIDVSAQKDRARQLKSQLLQIAQTYFPNQSIF